MNPATLAAGVNAGAALIGGGSSAKSAKYMQKQAFRHEVLMRGTQYQATVKDMKAAGLNPMMLAMGSGLSQGMSAPMAPSGQMGEAIGKAGSGIKDALLLKAQLGQMASATRLNDEMAAKAIQDAALVHTQIYTEGAKGWREQMVNEVERQRLSIMLDNMEKQGTLTTAEVDRIYADMGLNDARRRNLDASSAASHAAAALDRAGLPSARYKNSAVGILMDEVNRTGRTIADFLPTPKQGASEAAKYRRSGQRVYQNP